MAVARHSDNIEVQDGDQDDTDYENDTTVTARRTNVEMSEEGHYEALDLQKIDDSVYGDLRTKKKRSGRRPFRVVAGCLVMLCLILLGVIIAQAVHYHSPSNNMTNDTLVHHYDTLKSNFDTLTLDNIRLKILNSNLTQENNLLLSEVNQLKRQPADKCPSGCKKFEGSCYYRTTERTSWQEGREECRSQGAELVVINSSEEQVFIRGLRTEGAYGSWIGLNRTEGNWTWVDGTPLTTEYWHSGWTPNDGDKNCAAYYHWTDPGTWGNVRCSGTRASICEI